MLSIEHWKKTNKIKRSNNLIVSEYFSYIQLIFLWYEDMNYSWCKSKKKTKRKWRILSIDISSGHVDTLAWFRVKLLCTIHFISIDYFVCYRLIHFNFLHMQPTNRDGRMIERIKSVDDITVITCFYTFVLFARSFVCSWLIFSDRFVKSLYFI